MLSINYACAQKYTFKHYDIEDGLIQSQVNRFAQDADHRLWIGTFGGACRFDGKEFTGYSRQNGLPNNFVSTILADKQGRTWFGTLNGLAMLYNNKVTNYQPGISLKRNLVSNIVQDGAGTVWVTLGGQLFKISGNKMQQVMVNDSASYLVTSLAINSNGRLFAAVYQKGIYTLNGRKWVNVINTGTQYSNLPIRRILFDRFDKQKIYLLSAYNIFCARNGVAEAFEAKFTNTIKGQMLSLAQDAEGHMWIGTENGAYCINGAQIIHYTSVNGLSDNSITDILCDADNNLWLASLGNGVFRFEGDRLITFDSSQGIPDSKMVMSLTRDWNDDIVLGVDGGGLLRYDGKNINKITVPAYLKNIQCLYTDASKRIWIGTSLSGLWTYDKTGFGEIKGSEGLAVNCITADGNGVIYLATSMGCFYYQNGVLQQLKGIPPYISSLVATGRDSVFVGTQNGVVLAVDKKVMWTFKQTSLNNSAILTLKKFHGLMLIGTDDRGLFTWDMRNDNLKRYTDKDGLKSNSIYSLAADEGDNIWIGTGKGVNRMAFNAAAKTFKVIDNTGAREQVTEANQNAALYKDHKVWIGTTKAVLVYNTLARMQSSPPPHVIIQSAQLMPRVNGGGSTRHGALLNLDGCIRLNNDQNHLSITFLGVYLKNPEGVAYQYKLVGLDSSFCTLMKSNRVDYPSLPPGKYTFKVKAISPDGQVSPGTANFSFEIIPPFYQTVTFRVVAVIFLVLTGFGIQSFLQHRKVQRTNAIEAMKREEKIKIRQQTAEDFHDDLGNKLTRITVLSEILNAKIDTDKTDQRGIVDQIRQNAASLYNGTKDILWALDPKSDNLYETLNHIREIGLELFQDVPVDFEFAAIDDNLQLIKLPMEYSRNITMIFKELLTNIMKHADAATVTFNIDLTDKTEVKLRLADNGKGFDNSKIYRGRGINNINARAKRINAGLYIRSEVGSGTSVILMFSKIN